jgi:ParB-like chromosome segregation protein Spo0J
VPLAELQPDPTQPRKYMDPAAPDDTAASVGQVGIIQPVVCRQDGAMGDRLFLPLTIYPSQDCPKEDESS